MDDTLLSMLSQFGAAGLIGVLWVLERRHAASRDRQLDQAHQRLISQQHDVEVLLDVVRDNTRAISALESAQQRLIGLLETIAPARAVRR